MKKIILSIMSLFFLSQNSYASQTIEYHCVVDYTQGIMNEQAYYMQRKSYETSYDFYELGIRVASNNDPYYPERFFHLDESLVRDYKLTIDGAILTFKSNDKILINANLNDLDKHIQISTRIQFYTPSYLMVVFYFYNPETMKDKMAWTIYFDDREIIDELVTRNWGKAEDSNGYFLDCRNEIKKTTFKEYQQYWISLYEAISKQKAEYTKH